MTNTMTLYDLRRNRESIFIETLKELNNRVNSKDRSPYNLIRKSAILRFLIIDERKFYSTINKPYRIKIKTFLKTKAIQGNLWSSNRNSDGIFTRHIYDFDITGKEININNFLKLPIINFNNPQLKPFIKRNHIQDKYTISDIIKLIANGHGGVHIEDWGDDIPGQVLTDISSPFNINSNSKLHDAIDNISEIIIKTLEPLLNLVFRNIKTTQGIAWETSTIVRLQKKDEK